MLGGLSNLKYQAITDTEEQPGDCHVTNPDKSGKVPRNDGYLTTGAVDILNPQLHYPPFSTEVTVMELRK